MTTQLHTYTVPLMPSPIQERDLAQLSGNAHLVRQACVDQATLELSGHDTSLSALLGGPDHAERGAAAELRALMALPALSTVPRSLLRHAVEDQRARTARAGHPVSVAAPVAITGSTLISPIGARTLQLAGVSGELTVGVDCLPRWAASVWARTVGAQDPVPELELNGANVTGWTYVERGFYNGLEGWLIDIELRWDAWPVADLLRGLDEEQWPASDAVRSLMGRAR